MINVALSRPLIDALLFSLAIAIGITPQLLPAIVSVSLSSGSRALARKRVLVKRLVTIEDLGNIEVLFTDKTGHAHRGRDHVRRGARPGGRPRAPTRSLLGLVCNEATMTEAGPVGGNALDRRARRGTARPRRSLAPPAAPAYERLGLLPFDHERQLASVVVALARRATLLITKGAPEAVLARCVDVPAASRTRCSTACSPTARASSRSRPAPAPGLDAPAAGRRARPAARRLPHVRRPAEGRRRRGDRRARRASASPSRSSPATTAPSPPRSAATSASTVAGVLTGAELDALDDDALAAAIPGTTIFARVGPEQKSRLDQGRAPHGRRRRVPRRRRQRRRRAARRRRRHLGRLGDRRRQGRGRHRAARQGPRRARRRRHARAGASSPTRSSTC